MKNGTKARKIPCWYARGVLAVNLRRVLETHERTRDAGNRAAELEKLSGVSDSTINRILNSGSGADIDTIGNIALALKVPMSAFLTDPSAEATKSPELPTHADHISAITEKGTPKREQIKDEAGSGVSRKKKRHRR